MTIPLLARRQILAASSCLFPLAGCSLLPDPPPPQIYRLVPTSPGVAAAGPPLHAALAVALPSAPASLDTDRIALTLGRTRFDYFAAAVWTDRVPVLLQSLLVAAFEASGRIANVGRDPYGLARGYALETDIRAFQARYAGEGSRPPVVVVGLDLHLTTLPGRRMVAHSLITAAAPAADNKLDSIVRGFDEATGEALRRGLPWVLAALRGAGREA